MISIFKTHDDLEFFNDHLNLVKKPGQKGQADFVSTKNRMRNIGGKGVAKLPAKFMCMFIGS